METVDAEFQALAVQDEAPKVSIMPTVSPQEAQEAMRAYLELCDAILTDDDYQTFSQWDPKLRQKVNKKFKKKSAAKKLQAFYSIDVEILRETYQELPEGNFGFVVIARASTKSGRRADAEGACSTAEERFDVAQKDDETAAQHAARKKKALARSFHDVCSTAGTRARNRAVMEVLGLGGGEVTAEEVAAKYSKDDKPKNVTPRVSREDELRSALMERIRTAMKTATDYGLCGPTPDEFRDWAEKHVSECTGIAKGWKPNATQVDAIERQLVRITDELKERAPF